MNHILKIFQNKRPNESCEQRKIAAVEEWMRNILRSEFQHKHEFMVHFMNEQFFQNLKDDQTRYRASVKITTTMQNLLPQDPLWDMVWLRLTQPWPQPIMSTENTIQFLTQPRFLFFNQTYSNEHGDDQVEEKLNQLPMDSKYVEAVFALFCKALYTLSIRILTQGLKSTCERCFDAMGSCYEEEKVSQ